MTETSYFSLGVAGRARAGETLRGAQASGLSCSLSQRTHRPSGDEILSATREREPRPATLDVRGGTPRTTGRRPVLPNPQA